MKQDIYTRVTEKIIADLERGVRPWHQPWNAEHAAGRITRPLRHNGVPYAGMNVIMLWAEAMERGYGAPIWMTFRQAKELGGHVRKGERGSLVVYASTIRKTETDEETGEEIERDIPFMKGYQAVDKVPCCSAYPDMLWPKPIKINKMWYAGHRATTSSTACYTVFNVEQIEGLPAHYYATAEPPTLDAARRIEHAEAFLERTGAAVRHGGNRAYYAAGPDHIQMPPFEFFRDPESYYETRLHETTHWTRHPSRLAREFGRKRFGDEGYAMEELVAEIGSAFLSADLGLTPEVREDHAAYIRHWLKALKEDKRAIFTAAAHAQRAADFLQSLQPQPEPEPEAENAPAGAEPPRRELAQLDG